MRQTSVRVQTEDFSVDTLYSELRLLGPQVGAVVTFTGLVRDRGGEDAVEGLFLEHYPGMAEAQIETILRQASERWEILACSVVHRVGELKPNDQIVFVGVACQHRNDAFHAAQYIMDYLKTEAPFWKQECRQGHYQWVDAKESDQEAKDRWCL